MVKRLLSLAFLATLSVSCSVSEEVAAPTDAPTQNTATPIPSPTNDESMPMPSANYPRPSLVDVTYCTINGFALNMEVYFPADLSQPAPAVAYVHGGGWSQGDKHIGATEYNIDPDRIGALGASAGGHLVSLLGTSHTDAGFEVGEYVEYSSRVQAVVDVFAPSDLTLSFSEEQIQNAMQVFTADQLMPASPVTYITPDDPPFLILQGDQDDVVPLEQSQILYEALKLSGPNCWPGLPNPG